MEDLWTYLSHTDKPIVMYGMGNGADKILRVLESRNIAVADFFASDGFVRGHSFHGKRVLSFSEIKAKYSDFIILLSFGTCIPEVLSQIYKMADEYEMYAPDVPVTGNTLFTGDYYESMLPELERARSLLSDELSVKIFDLITEYRLTGSISCLRKAVCDKREVFGGILNPAGYKTYVDLGAYNGDTVRELISFGFTPGRVIALEPDRRSFRKLSEYASENSFITAYNAGAWNYNGESSLNGEGNRNSALIQPSDIVCRQGRAGSVKLLALDGIEGALQADFIKLDVEGSERQALEGSRAVIQSRSPDMLISVYHRSEDIFSLILYVHSLNPSYKLRLRRFEYIPAWDICLLATQK